MASVAELFPTGELKRRYKEVTLPVSEQKVSIRSLSEGELSKFNTAILNTSGTGMRQARMENANRRLIVLCLVDQAGNRLLSEDYIKKLVNWDGADTSFLSDECAAHCGISQRDIEDLVKNSEAMSAVDSPSSSPSA